MMKNVPLSKCRRLLLLVLLSFTLLGVQLVQNSPLHNHLQHTVDCALCHFQLSDDTEHSPQVQLAFEEGHHYEVPAATRAAFDHDPSPYQGRAPPRI